MRRNVMFIGVAVLSVAVLITVFVMRRGADAPAPPTMGAFERPMPWAPNPGAVSGTVDAANAVLRVGGVELLAPQPVGVALSWKHETRGPRQALVGTGKFAERDATFEWKLADGSPHTLFEGEFTATRAALTEPVFSTIALPDGELSYVDAALQRVAFAGTPVAMSALTAGPIVWRSGGQVLSLWQWNADRVTLAASDAGGFVIQFDWWVPGLHEMPGECALDEAEVTLTPQLTISFADAPDAARGRLPKGVASAVVPIFVDPLNAEDPRFRDAASGSAEDYAARARTIALGHSSPRDARHGNGGLGGLEVGGTIVIPAEYSAQNEVFDTLRTDLSSTTIELLPEADLRPADCAALQAGLADRSKALLRKPRMFDGKFPNLVGPQQVDSVPGVTGGAMTWQPTGLTGRRKDVVTQALSSTYLTKLADARGLAVLEIPIVATRNPLVAAAAEGLLDPEREGNWTIQEDLARALGEVELLSEDDRFDFVGLKRLTAYTRGASQVVIDEIGDGTWLVHNNGTDALGGFTLVLAGAVMATIDGEPVKSATRPMGNGEAQTWIWWDLSAGATYNLGITQAAPTPRSGVSWKLAK